MKFIRYTFLLSALIFIVSSGLSAQNMEFGIQGGGSAGVLIGPFNADTDSGKPIVKPSVGMFFNFPIGDAVAIRTEVNYLHTGVEYGTYVANVDTLWPLETQIGQETIVYNVETYLAGDVSGRYELRYIETPILFAWKTSKRFGLELGGHLGFLLEGSNTGNAILDIGQYAGLQEEFATEQEYVDALFLHELEQEFDESHVINRFDWGFTAGGRYFLSDRFSLRLNANYGMRPVQPRNKIMAGDYKNLYLTTSLAYSLGRLF